MNSKFTFSLFFISITAYLLFSGCASEPNYPPGLPSGETRISAFSDPSQPGARFNFESGKVVYEPDAPELGDIYFDKKFLCGSGQPLNVGIQDWQPGSIGFGTSAPSAGYKFPPGEPGIPSREAVYLSHIYWIKLTNGNYAKIKIKQAPLNEDTSDFEYIIFQWVYQPDGSADFRGNPDSSD